MSKYKLLYVCVYPQSPPDYCIPYFIYAYEDAYVYILHVCIYLYIYIIHIPDIHMCDSFLLSYDSF